MKVISPDPRVLTIHLVTVGDPARLTGGYLYHRRMAELAPEFDARIKFVRLPDLPFPLPLWAGRRILDRIPRPAPRALVLDSIAAAYVAPWLSLKPPPAPLVAMLHQPPGGVDHGLPRSALQALLDRAAYRKAAGLLVSSEALAADLESQGVSPARMRVVPPGRDLAAPAGPPEDLRLGRRCAFLCVANWFEHKGIHSLLDAFARLPDNDGTLHLAGAPDVDPAYARSIRDRLQRPDLSGRVVVHGSVAPERVAALYRDADVFVLPSMRESYGMAYAEAMSARLPIIGWRAGNLPNLVTDRVEALLIDPGDIPGLTRALATLTGDEALRTSLSAAAAARAATLPTWHDSARLFFSAVRRFVSEPVPVPNESASPL